VGEQTIEFEFQYTDKIDLDFYDFKVSKVAKKEGGKVESFKLDDPYISEEEKTKVLAVAQRYFELAESYI